MRLVTFTEGESERIGALDGGTVIDLPAVATRLYGDNPPPGLEVPFPGRMIELLELEEPGMEAARNLFAAADFDDVRIDIGNVRLLAPLPRPTSIRDFLLNEIHASNGGRKELPPEWYQIPAYWKGNCNSVLGPDDPVRWPVYTEKLDFELEVAAVIGRRGSRVGEHDAPSYIAGYTIFNDWSARDIQRREMTIGLGPGLGKDFAFTIGPCIVTPDEFAGPSARAVARVNGEVWSESSLEGMRVSFPELIAHLSIEQELLPGELLGSGTVARGCGIELDRWISVGDVVELEVESLGTLRSPIAPPLSL